MINSEKGSESQASITPLTNWVRGTAGCSIEGDYLVSHGGVVAYWPGPIHDLTGEFASIVDATGTARFATEYGPLELPKGVSRLGLVVPGIEWRESIESILVHAKKVSRIRSVVANIADTRSEVRENLSERLRSIWPVKVPFALDQHTATGKNVSLERLKHFYWGAIENMLNEHLHRSCERAHVNVRGEIENVLAFESLLALIYRRLFEELIRGKLRLCQECGTVFEWADPRQMYCSKRCGLNLAQRRHRKRQTKPVRK
jgi:hypothetical protein